MSLSHFYLLDLFSSSCNMRCQGLCREPSSPYYCLLCSFFFKKIYLFHVYGLFTCMYVCEPNIYTGWPQKPEEAFDSLELKLQTAVSSQVGAQHWVQVLWKAVGALNSWAPFLAPAFILLASCFFMLPFSLELFEGQGSKACLSLCLWDRWMSQKQQLINRWL